jgi:hypothetical protein
MNTALRASSLTLRELLREQLRVDLNLRSFFDPAQGGTMLVSLLTPEELGATGQQGLSLWLYRVERDEQTLNRPPKRVGLNRLQRSPLPLRLHYLVTPVVDNSSHADSPELEQNILGVVLQFFHDSTIFRGADLQSDLAGSSVELRVRLETLDLEQMTRVWDALERSYQLSISYEVSVVPIESARQVADASPVDVAIGEVGAMRAQEGAP